MLSDSALVDAARSGQPEAIDALWSRHRRWIAALLLRHKPDHTEVDDLLQDIASQLVAKIHTISEPGALPGWLRTTAINAARLAGRRQGVRARAGEAFGVDAHEAAERSASRPDGPGEATLTDAQRVLELARQLPADYAEPLLLRAVQGLSYAQIGAILGLPESTIETRIARGRRMLRDAAERGSVAGVRVRG